MAPKDDQEGVLGAPVKRPKGLWEAKKGAGYDWGHPLVALLELRGGGRGRGKPLPKGRGKRKVSQGSKRLDPKGRRITSLI